MALDATFWFLCIAFVIAIGANYWLMYRQMLSIHRLRSECSTQYAYAFVGQGVEKRITVFVLVCADEDGLIRKAYRMKGLTVLGRMKEFDGLEGRNACEIREEDDLPPSMDHRTKLAAISACGYVLAEQDKKAKELMDEASIEKSAEDPEVP